MAARGPLVGAISSSRPAALQGTPVQAGSICAGGSAREAAARRRRSPAGRVEGLAGAGPAGTPPLAPPNFPWVPGVSQRPLGRRRAAAARRDAVSPTILAPGQSPAPGRPVALGPEGMRQPQGPPLPGSAARASASGEWAPAAGRVPGAGPRVGGGALRRGQPAAFRVPCIQAGLQNHPKRLGRVSPGGVGGASYPFPPFPWSGKQSDANPRRIRPCGGLQGWARGSRAPRCFRTGAAFPNSVLTAIDGERRCSVRA